MCAIPVNHIFKTAACTITHKQTWLKISLHCSWMSVTKCYEYRWQLWLHWQAAEQLFVCPNGKYFVTRPCCPKDFLWHAAHITAAHHIKSLKTRLFCLWEAFASLPRHGRETLFDKLVSGFFFLLDSFLDHLKEKYMTQRNPKIMNIFRTFQLIKDEAISLLSPLGGSIKHRG